MELKSCPFCGGEAKIEQSIEDHWSVYCPNEECPARPDTAEYCCSGGDVVIKKWNTRKSDWIPVEERLPRESITVLVYTNFKDVYTCRRSVIEHTNDKELHVGQGIVHETITHWQPLPDLPQ